VKASSQGQLQIDNGYVYGGTNSNDNNMHLAADEHARSSESLVDSDTRLKHLIEDKYMGRLSQWQMSYVCRPDVQQSEPRIDSELSPYRSYLRRRQLHTCRRSGSVSEELEQTLMRQSHSYWYTNVKLKNKAKPSQSPQRLVEDLKQKLKNNATKFKVFFGESKLPQKEPAEKPQ